MRKPDPIVDAFTNVEFEDDKKKKAVENSKSPSELQYLKTLGVDKQSFEEAALKAAKEVAELVISKQKDYGPGNILNSIVKPEIAIAVRLTDKIARLVNLVEAGKTPTNETLTDTAMDIMGYGLVLYMVLNGTFTLPLESQ